MPPLAVDPVVPVPTPPPSLLPRRSTCRVLAAIFDAMVGVGPRGGGDGCAEEEDDDDEFEFEFEFEFDGFDGFEEAAIDVKGTVR
jgi:hypothetical protein